MAVTGLNNLPVSEFAYPGENCPPVSRRLCDQERSTTQTSSIRKMWQELESEHISGENGRQQMSRVSNGNLENACSCSSGRGVESEDASMDGHEVENECPQNQNQIGVQNGQEDHNRLGLHCSPAFGVAEKERVRQTFREWKSKSFAGHTSRGSSVKNCSRAQWLGENESKRVRIVREWLELSTQQGDTCAGTGTEEQATQIGSQIEQVQDGLADNNQRDGAQRPIRRLYGRQALLDLLAKFERERKRELQGLLENRFVSNFAHRIRIQALLKGRFLRNQKFVQDEKHTSLAASELGFLRQTHAVSDIRKGFLSKLNNHDHNPEGAQSVTSSNNDMKCEHSQDNFQEIPDEIADEFEIANMASDWETHSPQDFAAQVRGRHEQVLEDEEREKLPTKVEFIEATSQDREDSQRNQGVYHIELSQETPDNEYIGQPDVDEIMLDHFPLLRTLETRADSFNWQDDDGGWHQMASNENDHEWYQETAESDFQESHEEWYENVLEETTESWFGGHSYQETAPVGRADTFYSPEDNANGSRVELGELMSRRRVSNLLQSDFRVRLDQVLQSYLDRQDQDFESDDEWIVDREQHDLEQLSDENTGDVETVERTEGAADWQFPAIHEHNGNELEIINGLRSDMAELQQRMDDMQRMLEVCMDMQLELQRSVNQEVYAALNQPSNSGEGCEDEAESSHGKKEGCFLCCNDSIDSSPNRCGNVYVCPNCAEKINWSKLKKSMMHP